MTQNSFATKNGQGFTLQLTASLVRQVREILGLDLMADHSFMTLANDVGLFVDVLYLLCREQADALGMTDVQFGESLTPKLLEPAADALCRAVVVFRPAWRKKRMRDFLADKQRLFKGATNGR